MQNKINVSNKLKIKSLELFNFCVPIEAIKGEQCECWILLMAEIYSFDQDQFSLTIKIIKE